MVDPNGAQVEAHPQPPPQPTPILNQISLHSGLVCRKHLATPPNLAPQTF